MGGREGGREGGRGGRGREKEREREGERRRGREREGEGGKGREGERERMRWVRIKNVEVIRKDGIAEISIPITMTVPHLAVLKAHKIANHFNPISDSISAQALPRNRSVTCYHLQLGSTSLPLTSLTTHISKEGGRNSIQFAPLNMKQGSYTSNEHHSHNTISIHCALYD